MHYKSEETLVFLLKNALAGGQWQCEVDTTHIDKAETNLCLNGTCINVATYGTCLLTYLLA